MLLCTGLFLAVALGSYAVFGSGVPADVLENFSDRQAQRTLCRKLAYYEIQRMVPMTARGALAGARVPPMT